MTVAGLGRALGLAVLGLAALVGAYGFGTPALVPLGVGALVAPILALLAVEAVSRGVRLSRRISPEKARVGDAVRVEVDVTGWPVRTGAFRALDATVVPGVPQELGRLRRLGGARDRGVARLGVDGVRRGEYSLPAPELRLADPFGIVARTVSGPAGPLLRVAPTPLPVRAPIVDGDGDGLGVGAGRRRHSLGLDLDGVRDYMQGDPLSRVHWGQSARRGRLQTKDMHAGGDGGRPASVILDCSPDADPDAFELAVVAAASLCAHLVGAGRPVVLVHGADGGSERPTSDWEDVERALSRVGRDAPVGGAEVLSGLVGRRPAPAAAVLVTASPDPAVAAAVRSARRAGTRVGCILLGAAAGLLHEVETAGGRTLVASTPEGLAAALGAPAGPSTREPMVHAGA